MIVLIEIECFEPKTTKSYQSFNVIKLKQVKNEEKKVSKFISKPIKVFCGSFPLKSSIPTKEKIKRIKVIIKALEIKLDNVFLETM